MSRKQLKPSFNGTYQKFYDGDVIFRLMGEDKKKMAEFHQDYKNSCHRKTSGFLPPNAKEREIAEMWRKGALVREIVQKYHITHSRVESTIRRVAKWDFLHG